MKKRNKRIAIIVCISICVVIFAFAVYRFTIPSEAYDLIEHKDEYTQIAELCYLDYLQLKSEDENIERSGYLYSIGNKRLTCYSKDDHRILLTDDECKSLETVVNNFCLDGHSLAFIEVHDNFVAFGIANYRESYIYSLNNDKPNFVNRTDENYKKIYVQKVADHWYYAYVIQQ